MEDILWLIPARSGSNSIKDKNIKLLNGIPLINYRIRTALSLSKKDYVWVSTDSQQYADIASKSGATIPFLRPASLSTDNASSMDVVLHAMQYAETNNFKFDFICLLEPTSPFVYFKDIENAYNCLKHDSIADSIVAVKEVRPNTFFIQDDSKYLDELAERLEKRTKLGRQEFKRQVTPSGGFYISRWDSFLRNKTFYTKRTLGYLVPEECSLEIDEPLDWNWAEFLITEKLVDTSKLFNNDSKFK